MSRPIRALLVLGVLLLSADSLSAKRKKEGPEATYQRAVDRLGDLDLDMAYESADAVVRDFPDSGDAEKARLLKVVISTIKLQSFDVLRKKYADAMSEAVLYNDKKKLRDAHVEATDKVVKSGKVLVVDVKALFEYAGRPLSIEVTKNYDDLKLLNETYKPYKILEIGFAPAAGEEKKIEKLQHSMSLNFVLGRLLAEDAEKKRMLKGDVDWVGCMTIVGDWLLHYAAVCKVGWIYPMMEKKVKDPKQARSGYETAIQCFEKVMSLAGKPNDKRKLRAVQRIKEIKGVLDGMK